MKLFFLKNMLYLTTQFPENHSPLFFFIVINAAQCCALTLSKFLFKLDAEAFDYRASQIIDQVFTTQYVPPNTFYDMSSIQRFPQHHVLMILSNSNIISNQTNLIFLFHSGNTQYNGNARLFAIRHFALFHCFEITFDMLLILGFPINAYDTFMQLPAKVISHTFKSRQQDIKDALLVGWFALTSVTIICVPNYYSY